MMRRLGVVSGSNGARVFAISAIAILLLVNLAPVVAAKAPRGGRVVIVEQIVDIEADDSLNWTVLANIANNSDYKFLDYNLSWQPFYENNTDISGVTVHSIFSPLQFSLNTTNETVSTGSMFQLSSDQIMDGVSEVWFRIPILDIPVNSSIRTKVYRISSGTAFNFSFSDFGTISTSTNDLMNIIYDLTIDPSIGNVTSIVDRPMAFQDYVRWQNVTVPDTNDTLHYNWTYVKACLGMFPNEWYLVEFDIYAPYADGMKLAISTSDFGNDGLYNSWIWCAGTSYYMPIDLDTSFIAVYGVSNGITGIGTSLLTRASTQNNLFYMNASIPVNQVVDNSTNRYFNILVPILADPTFLPQTLSVLVWFYSGASNTTWFHHTSTSSHVMNGTYHSFIISEDLDSYDGYNIDHIQLEFKVTGLADTPNSTCFKLWGVQRTINETQVGFTDIYWLGWVVYPGEFHWIMKERQFFIPYGYYGLDSWYWNMTNATFVTIPINRPTTEIEIIESIQQFEMYLKGLHDDDVDYWEIFENWIFDRLWNVADFIYNTVARVGADIIKWVWENTPLGDFMRWLLEGSFAIFKFFGAIGVWLWDTINLIIDALEWFSYWAVRIIYSASVAIVYMINIFGVISINSALLNVARTGNGRDFVYAFRAGWKFVLAIITLLLSLAVMAVSIVSAVVPF